VVSPLPHESTKSGSTVQGGSIFAESLEQRNSGGVQGGSTVQGIGLDLEKNKISVLEEPSLEKLSTVALTGISGGGQSECRVDSSTLTQNNPNYEDYPHLTCDNIDAKRNQAEDIKERLLQAQTKQDLIEIREQYSNRCDWVWKNLLTKAQRQTLKEIAAVEQLDIFATQTASTEISESATQCELPLYQRVDGQIEVDRQLIDTAAPIENSDLSEWMTAEELEGMARNLAECEDADTLALLRGFWHPEAMNAACKLLPAEKHAQIKEWVIELNNFKSS
jgi:hypothetical protein